MRYKIIMAAVGAASLAAAAAFSRGLTGLPLDDAYIHLTFARNLAQGKGLCFNPGEFSLGFSSPLWIALLAGAKLAGAALVQAAKVFSQIAFAISCALVFEITRRSLPKDQADQWRHLAMAMLASAGVFLSGNMLWLAGAGMEPFLFLALGLGAILLVQTEKPKPLCAGALLGLAGLARTSALALIIIIALITVFSRKRSLRAWAGLAVAVLLPAAWHLYSFIATGHLIPPTRAGKLASNLFNAGPSAKGAALYAWRHLAHLWLYERGIVIMALICLAAAILSLVLYLATKKKNKDTQTRDGKRLAERIASLSPASVLGLWFVLHFGAHMLLFRSAEIITPYHNLRYHPMLFPAVFSLSAISLFYCAAAFARAGRSRAVFVLAILFLLAPVIIEGMGIQRWRTYYARNTDQLQKEHKAAAEWANVFLEKDARIACLDVGILGFYSERYVIDLGGLIDPAVIPWLEKDRTGPYLMEKNATHYFAMVRHDSERITGVKKDYGRLYRLGLMDRFHYPFYPRPVFLHSLGINAYKILPPEEGGDSRAGKLQSD
ncbi:MAG: hypothetical protein R6V10_16190 [bacterium]